MQRAKILTVLLLLMLSQGRSTAVEASGTKGPMNLFSSENLVAWCIVPFDNQHRNSAQRMEMLQRLGISQYAWDWRSQHIAQLPGEIAAAKAKGIKLRAVWLWIDDRTDRVGQLNESNRVIIDTVRQAGLTMEYWIGFHENFYTGLSDAECVAKGSAMIDYVRSQIGSADTVVLYNHLDWFGEPENQLKIIAQAGPRQLGMIYNFHHGHEQIVRFPELLPQMLPYLRCVTLNGMKPGGPKIIPIGSGTHEQDMIRLLAASSYAGPIAILGHVEDADVETVLRGNLLGLQKLGLK